jgi:hypothetical protein
VNHARLQQYRRLSRAGTAAAASAAAGLVALALASAGAMSIAGVLAIAAVALGLYARRWLRLAGRSRIGARSEDEVCRVLAPLQAEGWRLRHSSPWRGRGDIDSAAIAPSGVGARSRRRPGPMTAATCVVRRQAAWLWRKRRRWCRLGAMPVLCVVRAVGIQRWERGVLVVSLEALIPTLRHAAAEALHPMSSIGRWQCRCTRTCAWSRGCRKIGVVREG